MRLLILFALAMTLFAAESGDPSLEAMPTSATTLATDDVRLGKAMFANTTAGALTITIADRSTNCGGSACSVWASVSIAANTTYHADFFNVPMVDGFTVQASGSGINYWITWGRI